MTAPVFLKRKWLYESGASTEVVTAAEVRRAPYHARLRKLGPEATELATLDLRDLHARDWTSRVHVYQALPGDGQGSAWLGLEDSAACRFVMGDGEYHTGPLEDLRGTVLADGDGAADCGRLVVVEDLTPPVLEILGWTLDVDAAVFARHVEDAWGWRARALTPAPDAVLLRRDAGRLALQVRFPRLLTVAHPSALKHAYPEWRDDCLQRAARHLQCRRLLPLLDMPDESQAYCVGFEHCTVSARLGDGRGRDWDTLVLFPPSIKEWRDGHLHVAKRWFLSPGVDMSKLKHYESLTDDVDVVNWLDRVEGDKGDMGAASIFISLSREALNHWNLLAQQAARAVELSTNGSWRSRSEEMGLETQRQLRTVVVQSAAMISDAIDDLQKVVDFVPTPNEWQPRSREKKKKVAEMVRQVGEEYGIVKGQLERLLPMLQNHIDFSIVRQQVRLAETQLEESRKAIQQADTIKRLTMLAFIYIPIQTAAAVLGMNLSELSPNPSIWVFLVLAVGLLAVTMSAAGWHRIVPVLHRSYSRAFNSVRSGVYGMLRTIGFNVADGAWVDEKLSAWQRDPEPSWFQ